MLVRNARSFRKKNKKMENCSSDDGKVNLQSRFIV